MNQNNNQAFQQNAASQQMHAGPGLGQAYTQLQQGNQGNTNMQNLAQNKGLQNTSSGQSQYARNNNYYQPSIKQGGGVNQYGAKFSSGTRDEDIGSAYYQSQPAQNAPQNNIRSQYTGNQPTNMQYGMNNNTGQSQYARNNNYYQPSIQQGGGVNQYGAKFSSGTRDEDIGSAYYQSQSAQNAPQNNIRSQYTGNQPTNMQYGMNNNTAGQSQYARNNNYYQSSMQQGGGVNQYGAKFSSGTRDEDIGSAYYQSQPAQNAPQNNIRSQYTGNQPTNMQYGMNNNTGQSQYARNNNYYQPSIQQGGGVNQYGAKFSSGTRDKDIGSAYYQSKQRF